MFHCHIVCRGGVERIDAVIFIDVMDQFVHILVILVSRDPLEV